MTVTAYRIVATLPDGAVAYSEDAPSDAETSQIAEARDLAVLSGEISAEDAEAATWTLEPVV